MNAEFLLRHFDRISEAPEAIPQLRNFVLDLAVKGKLADQDPNDEHAILLLDRLWASSDAGRKDRVHIASTNPPFALPRAWAFTTLGALASKITDGAHKTPTYVPEGIPFVSVKDFSGGCLDLSGTRFITRTEHEKLYRRCDPKRGDILIGRIGTLGKAVLVDTDVEFSLFVSVGLIRFSHEFTNPAYLQLLLNSPFVDSEFNRIKVGGGTHTNKLNLGDLHTVGLPIPPLNEQARIVAKVNQVMAFCDQLEEAKFHTTARRRRLANSVAQVCSTASADRLRSTVEFATSHLKSLTGEPEQLVELKSVFLNLAFQGRLQFGSQGDEPVAIALERLCKEREHAEKVGNIKPLPPVGLHRPPFPVPTGWIWTRLGDLVVSADSGWSPKTESFPRVGTEWGVLKVSAVSWGRFQPEQNKQLLPGTPPKLDALVRRGDFLISRANTSELVAKSVIVNDEPTNLIMSDKIVRLRFGQDCNRQFLSLVNNHAYYARAYYAERATGTSLSMKNVSRDIIYNLLIPFPPLSEQARIVRFAQHLDEVFNGLEASLLDIQNAANIFSASVLKWVLATDSDEISGFSGWSSRSDLKERDVPITPLN